MSNIHKGHRERVKDEFRKNGLDHFQHHKILEFLLFYSIPRGDTNPAGHKLLERFGSFSGVFDAPVEMLEEVEGIGRETATFIKLVSEVIRKYMDDHTSQIDTLLDIEAAKEYMRYKFLCRTTEHILMICLSNNGKIIYSDILAEGSPETVSISPAKLVKTALRANASRVILAHNHPNGICNPSGRDLGTTSVMFQELRRVDIKLEDHIIVAPDGIYSMKENGLIK